MMKRTMWILLAMVATSLSAACGPVDHPSNDNPNNPDNPVTPDNPVKPDSWPSQAGSGETDGYHLVWADYFDGETLDREVWNVEINNSGCGNAELEYYTDREENVSMGIEPVSGRHCLIITAKKERYGDKQCTSGRINSNNKKSFLHGKIEALIYLPRTADGLWPAFWMMGEDIDEVSWPNCGEIDILEMGNSTGIRNKTQDRYFNGACHWGFYKDVGGGNWAYPNYAKATTNSYDMQDGFHLFTCIWDNDSIKMYLDLDKYPNADPYYEIGITAPANPNDPAEEWNTGLYFHKPNFILFNLAIGGNFTGIWDINKITALAGDDKKMYIDYVKVYQK